MATPELRYQTGFWNDFETEAVPGALPEGRNFPQQVPHGLYCRVDHGHTLYHAAFRQSPHVDLPNSAFDECTVPFRKWIRA